MDRSHERSLAQLRLDLEQAAPTARLVFGEGAVDARLVIVGEAPGAAEERTGHPFSGQCGKLLDRLLAENRIARSEVWVTNVVKQRPIMYRDGRPVTRPPTRQEIELYRPWLELELAAIRPRVVLCLGTIAASALIHDRFRMATERGVWFVLSGGRSRVLATYHPSYLRRFGRALIDVACEDIEKAWLAADVLAMGQKADDA